MAGGPTIVSLNQVMAAGLADELEDLDRQLSDFMGTAFADEEWTSGHFLLERPDKWRFSHIAFGPQGRLCGFWIASRESALSVRTHRVGVRPGDQRRGVGTLLFDAFARSLRSEGVQETTLMVNRANLGAMQFYLSLGYRMEPPHVFDTVNVGRGWRLAPKRPSSRQLKVDDRQRLVLRIGGTI